MNGPESPPTRILVRGVNWLGDAVMTTPALRRLRERFPQAHISLATQSKLAQLWQSQPDISEVIPLEAGAGLWAAARLLRSVRADLALVFPNSPRSALEAWLARVPRRVGYSRSWRNWFLTTAVPSRPGRVRMRKLSDAEVRARVRSGTFPEAPPPSAHHIHEYLHLVGALGASEEPCAPRLAVTAQEIHAAAHSFCVNRLVSEGWPIIGLNPGAEYGPAKRWPLERFAETAEGLTPRCAFLIFGGKGDVDPASLLASRLTQVRAPHVNVAGRTNLRELCALLRCCRALLTNDTGPMHVAAALDVPVVVPFGSTSPELTGPGLPGMTNHRLLTAKPPCSPCFRRECPIDFRCMTAISVQSAREAVAQIAGLL